MDRCMSHKVAAPIVVDNAKGTSPTDGRRVDDIEGIESSSPSMPPGRNQPTARHAGPQSQ